jgi:TRAP-type transport system small permease protein
MKGVDRRRIDEEAGARSRTRLLRGARGLGTLCAWLPAYVGGAAAGLIIVAATVLILVEVFARTFFGWSTLVAEDLGGYAMVGILFLGLAYTLQTERHTRFTVVLSHLNPRQRRVLERVAALIALACLLYLLPQVWRLVYISFVRDLRSNSIGRIPLVWPQALLFVGLALMALQWLVRLVRGR